MRSRKWFIFPAILLILSLLSSCICAQEAGNERDILKDIILYNGFYGNAAKEKTRELFGELYALDENTAVKWENIIELWNTVDQDTEIHEGVLPDGLPDSDALCFIALGFQLNPDGSLKPELLERLKAVKESAEKYPNALIVCTGGGTAMMNQYVTEAGQMAQWLMENGIDENRIIVEDQSRTTTQNAIYSLRILKEQYPQVTSLAIISSDYHIPMGVLLFAAEIMLTEEPDIPSMKIVSNAACIIPGKEYPLTDQIGSLIELAGDEELAFDFYLKRYDMQKVPALN